MIEEAITKLVTLADEARNPKILKVEGDPPNLRRIISPGGEVETIKLEPGYRTVHLQRIEDLVELGKKHFDPAVRGAGRMVCLYTHDAVELLFDSDNSRERACLRLEASDEHKFFDHSIESPLMSVQDLRHAMRITLRGCGIDKNLIEGVSRLAFDARDQQQVKIGRGAESMGKAITQEVQQPEELPDENQVFHLRRWINHDLNFRLPVCCVLDPDLASRRWFIQPIADSWARYEQDSLEVVGGRLHNAFEEIIPVYQGVWQQAG